MQKQNENIGLSVRSARIMMMLLCLPLLLFPMLHHALEMESKIVTLLKALSSEKTFMQHQTPIVIGIVYQSTVPGSDSACRQILSLDLTEPTEAFGFPQVTFLPMDIAGQQHWRTSLPLNGLSAVIIAPVDKVILPEIVAFSRERRILSLTTVEGYVERGVSVGVELIDHHPVLLVNLAASHDEGAQFSSRMLQLAKIIR